MIVQSRYGALTRAVASACLLVLFSAFAFAGTSPAQARKIGNDTMIAIDAPSTRDPNARRHRLAARTAKHHLRFGLSRFTFAPLRLASDVLHEAARFIGHRNPTGFRGPWCAAFVNLVLDRSGHRHVRSLRAIDALGDGRRVADPRPGDIAVMRGHVTFFAGYGGRGFFGLGGNQHHRVQISSFPLRRVVAFIRPA